MYTENLSIQSFDEELWSSLENEKKRQEEHIELIASENYTSPRVLEAQGSVPVSYTHLTLPTIYSV